MTLRRRRATSRTTAGSAALGEQLEDIERDAIIKALEQTRYNKTAAAKLLGMSFRRCAIASRSWASSDAPGS